MNERQLIAGGLLLGALLGTVALRQVALSQGAVLGLDHVDVLVIGLAISALTMKRAIAQ